LIACALTASRPNWDAEALKRRDDIVKMLRKIISGGQTGADRAGLDFAIETILEHGGYVARGRKAEDGRIDDRYNLIELSTSSYPARTRRNIEKSDGTVIFSLERVLGGGTKLTLELANKLGKPVLHIYDTRKERISNPESLCIEIQALTDFVSSNKIEILNVAGPRESKEPGVYDWTLTMLRLFLNRTTSGAGSTEAAGE
jgi:Circularly permutated YpsA SLOG family